MNISENDRALLLAFQRARLAYAMYWEEVPESHKALERALESLKSITEPTIAGLVKQWFEKIEPEAIEKLYALSFQFGDNTRFDNNLIQ